MRSDDLVLWLDAQKRYSGLARPGQRATPDRWLEDELEKRKPVEATEEDVSPFVLRAKWVPCPVFMRGRRKLPVAGIVMHSTNCLEEYGRIPGLIGFGSQITSTHYYVTKAGDLYQFVKEADTAIHMGEVKKAAWSDRKTIGIHLEHRDPTEDHPFYESWPKEQIVTFAKLMTHLARVYGPHVLLKPHSFGARHDRFCTCPVEFPWPMYGRAIRKLRGEPWSVEAVTA